jgi:hypothetical protein
MKQLAIIALGGLLSTWMAHAEPRTFTNAEGNTVEAELISLEDETVVLKLRNGTAAKVPLKTLSESDQSFVTAWWEENKDKLKPMDVRLTIDKKADRIDRTVTSTGGGNRNALNQPPPIIKKVTIDEFHYIGELKSYVRKDVEDITVDYTIYKRVSTNDKDGLDTTVEEIDGTDTIRVLKGLGSATFETDEVQCEDISETGGNKPRTSKRETILGVVFTLSAGGQDFLKQSDPDNLIERLEEEEKR